MTIPNRCKCCDGFALPFAELDFSKSCEDRNLSPFSPSGKVIPYFRCSRCGFIFTAHFDDWPPRRMQDEIYNEDYYLADPGFEEARPLAFAVSLANWLAPLRSEIASLDYGGGSGVLAAIMRQKGYDYDSYDPYFINTTLPARLYALATSFEVAEHATDPMKTFATMMSFLNRDGALLFSTNLSPCGVTSDWWYIAPRNGHVSIYTARSLQCLADRLGTRFLTLEDHIHLMYHRVSDRVPRTLLNRDVSAVLWHASRQNFKALISASLAAIQLGHPISALDPRNVARLLLRGNQNMG